MSASKAAGHTRPNVLLIMADDLGFSDIGCYGGEIRTPRIDALAESGIRMSQFYNTARCSPARAALLTGLHPHEAGIGVLTDDDGPGGYPGTLNDRCVTMAEALGGLGYSTGISGKWHLTGAIDAPNDAWPTRRGFDWFYGILAGAASYYQPVSLMRGEVPEPEPGDDFYLTTALGQEGAEFVRNHDATRPEDPFFLYLPFTAPHWPLHAPREMVESYRDTFNDGWDALRQRRYERLVNMGIINGHWPLSDRDPEVVAWDRVADKEWQARRMEVYAAQVEMMDAAIGTVVDAIAEAGRLNDTLIMFVSDNGGCAEEIPPSWVDELDEIPIHTPERTVDGSRVRRGNDTTVMPGPPETYASYGRPWANVSNTPFREYKRWVHEGGISTPLVVNWPHGGLEHGILHDPFQLQDVLPTVLEIVGADYPSEYPGRDPLPIEGSSMLAAWRGEPSHDRPLFFEHEGNCAVREGRWKLVRAYGGPWELYDLDRDRTELDDIASRYPGRVERLSDQWEAWAARCGVKPRQQVIEAARARAGRNSVVHVSASHRSSHEMKEVAT